MEDGSEQGSRILLEILRKDPKSSALLKKLEEVSQQVNLEEGGELNLEDVNIRSLVDGFTEELETWSHKRVEEDVADEALRFATSAGFVPTQVQGVTPAQLRTAALAASKEIFGDNATVSQLSQFLSTTPTNVEVLEAAMTEHLCFESALVSISSSLGGGTSASQVGLALQDEEWREEVWQTLEASTAHGSIDEALQLMQRGAILSEETQAQLHSIADQVVKRQVYSELVGALQQLPPPLKDAFRAAHEAGLPSRIQRRVASTALQTELGPQVDTLSWARELATNGSAPHSEQVALKVGDALLQAGRTYGADKLPQLLASMARAQYTAVQDSEHLAPMFQTRMAAFVASPSSVESCLAIAHATYGEQVPPYILSRRFQSFSSMPVSVRLDLARAFSDAVEASEIYGTELQILELLESSGVLDMSSPFVSLAVGQLRQHPEALHSLVQAMTDQMGQAQHQATKYVDMDGDGAADVQVIIDEATDVVSVQHTLNMGQDYASDVEKLVQALQQTEGGEGQVEMLRQVAVAQVSSQAQAMLEDQMFDHLGTMLDGIPHAAEGISWAKAGEVRRTRLLAVFTEVYGTNLLQATEDFTKPGDKIAAARLSRLQEGAMGEVMVLVEEFMEAQLCEGVLQMAGMHNSTLAASMQGVLALVDPEDAIEINHAVFEAVEEATGIGKDTSLQEYLMHLSTEQLSEEETTRIYTATEKLLAKLGDKYFDRILQATVGRLLGNTSVVDFLMDQDFLSDTIKVAVLKVFTEVFGEETTIMEVLQEVHAGRAPHAKIAMLMSKLGDALMEEAQIQATEAVKLMFADDPIMGPLLAQESATGAFRTELLSVVRTAFGDGDLPISEVFQRVRDHKMTRSQKRKLYDALADLAMAKQEQWLLDNKDSLLEIEEALHLSVFQETYIRVLTLLAFPLLFAVWAVFFPLVIVMLALNLLTFFQSEYLYFGLVLIGLLWEASGSLVLSDAVAFVSPMSGALVLIYNTARIALQKDIRGGLYEHAREPLRRLLRIFFREVHHMHRRKAKGLALFKYGPLGDGKELYDGEDAEEEEDDAEDLRDLQEVLGLEGDTADAENTGLVPSDDDAEDEGESNALLAPASQSGRTPGSYGGLSDGNL